VGNSVSKENAGRSLRVSRGIVLLVVWRGLVRVAIVAYRQEGAWRGVAWRYRAAPHCVQSRILSAGGRHRPNRIPAKRQGVGRFCLTIYEVPARLTQAHTINECMTRGQYEEGYLMYSRAIQVTVAGKAMLPATSVMPTLEIHTWNTSQSLTAEFTFQEQVHKDEPSLLFLKMKFMIRLWLGVQKLATWRRVILCVDRNVLMVFILSDVDAASGDRNPPNTILQCSPHARALVFGIVSCHALIG
jgi:hypothetical protein